MSLEELRKKHHQEAEKVVTGFWNPKVGDNLIGKIVGTKQISEIDRWVFYNVPTAQYFILPNHGHLNKQIPADAQGKFFYIELASESLLRSGPGKGKMGKLYYVKELSQDDIDDLMKSEGMEEKIVVEVEEPEAVDNSSTESEVPF